MGSTQIDWATKTWNPIEGCAPCSPGCERCWARKFAHRARGLFVGNKNFDIAAKYRDIEKWDGTLAEFPSRWREPLHWRKPQRVFVGSRSDVALWPEQARQNLVGMMYDAPCHKYMLLTKRPDLWGKNPVGTGRSNVFLGLTVCNQQEADEKIPQLLRIPAAGYWLSVEPMLEGIMIPAQVKRIDWLVCGGESGKGARPINPDWVRSLRDQCRDAGVAFYVKQMSPGEAIPEDLNIKEIPNAMQV